MKIAHSKTEKDKVINVRQTEHEKQKLLNRIRPHKGHTLFEYNIETNEIKKAKIEAVLEYPEATGLKKVQKKVVAQRNCLYVSALNEKNAIKKLKKRYTS